jgi:hypothetical protein
MPRLPATPTQHTINATLPPTLAEFRAMFPEFASASDELVQVYLDIAMLWVDDFWDPLDAKIAALYAAAHYLEMHNRASGDTLFDDGSSGGIGGSGGSDPEVGKIWVKSVRFRDRMVSYARVDASSDTTASGGKTPSSAEEFWKGTIYGQMYLSFLRRNVPHVAVV